MDYHKNAPWTAVSRERLGRMVKNDPEVSSPAGWKRERLGCRVVDDGENGGFNVPGNERFQMPGKCPICIGKLEGTPLPIFRAKIFILNWLAIRLRAKFLL